MPPVTIYQKEGTAQSRARPFGYTIWALIWLAMTVCLLAVTPLILYAVFNNLLRQESAPTPVGTVLTWVIGVPAYAATFFVFPWIAVSQTMLGFTLAIQSLRKENRTRPVAGMIGNYRYGTLFPLLSTPATRLWASVGRVARFTPWFYAAACAAVLGGALLITPGTGLFGIATAALGTVLYVFASILRLRTELPLGIRERR
jgi:hypothetical protein